MREARCILNSAPITIFGSSQSEFISGGPLRFERPSSNRQIPISKLYTNLTYRVLSHEIPCDTRSIWISRNRNIFFSPQKTRKPCLEYLAEHDLVISPAKNAIKYVGRKIIFQNHNECMVLYLTQR